MEKRVVILCGHYGSGKTNIAVNLALKLKKTYPCAALADLDIVNPYYRSLDSAKELTDAGVRLIGSAYANTNLDSPALPQEIFSVTDDKSCRVVVDAGGDDRGALALGRLAPALLRENDYEMLAVVNMFRPLTRTAADTVSVLREIERACGIGFTAIVNNSNLGEETTPSAVLESLAYADEISEILGVPVKMTAARAELAVSLADKIPNLFVLKLQPKIV